APGPSPVPFSPRHAAQPLLKSVRAAAAWFTAGSGGGASASDGTAVCPSLTSPEGASFFEQPSTRIAAKHIDPSTSFDILPSPVAHRSAVDSEAPPVERRRRSADQVPPVELPPGGAQRRAAQDERPGHP